jgi:anti-anti-sigma factor
VPVLILSGRLGSSAARTLDEAIRRSLDGHCSLVIDVAGVDYVSSRSLGVLGQAAARCARNGGALVLARVTPAVRLAIDFAATNPPIETESTVDAAVARALVGGSRPIR